MSECTSWSQTTNPNNTSPPVATNGTLTVAGNASATAINIPAPSDPNYAASQLAVTVTALPTDGSVLLSNGTTPVTVGETLTVAQLTGLEFQPTAGVFGQSSTFTYSVKDPAGLTATGSETLKTAAGTGVSPDGTTLMEGSAGSLVTGAGTWTFGTLGGPVATILLNGQQAAGGWGAELLVANQGNSLHREQSRHLVRMERCQLVANDQPKQHISAGRYQRHLDGCR